MALCARPKMGHPNRAGWVPLTSSWTFFLSNPVAGQISQGARGMCATPRMASPFANCENVVGHHGSCSFLAMAGGCRCRIHRPLLWQPPLSIPGRLWPCHHTHRHTPSADRVRFGSGPLGIRTTGGGADGRHAAAAQPRHPRPGQDDHQAGRLPGAALRWCVPLPPVAVVPRLGESVETILSKAH